VFFLGLILGDFFEKYQQKISLFLPKFDFFSGPITVGFSGIISVLSGSYDFLPFF
jgi:hypothetical protein